MEPKKKMTILIVIALILAITAITLTSINSREVSTTGQDSSLSPTGAVIGISIEPSQVEDKLADNSPQ